MVEINKQIQEFEEILGVKFREPEMLQRALTHRSFVNEVEGDMRDNERLEFLGDAILDFVVGDMLFRRFVDVSEGELTQLRAALVRTDSLAMLASDCRLGEFLLIGKGEEHSGGRTRVNTLCCGFEAVIAAIYMDSGLDAVKQFAIPRLEALLEYVLENNLHKDARSMLQERTQAELRVTPVYRLIDASGPDHEKEFFLEVVVGDVVIGAGVGTSKRSAAQSAARAALQRLEDVGWSEEAQLMIAALDDNSDAANEASDEANEEVSGAVNIEAVTPQAS
ncbi:MAG: ribonuclease III [Anaerolineae bacterium]|nr:ribonuclease III [Anaerolineae bacterium]MDQ7037401.1 ribonuclease III [Anaerolineae bacterium]